MRKIQIDASVFLCWALAILILPPAWIGAVLLGTLVHEVCHYIAARLMGITVYEIQCSVNGCRMYTAPMDKLEEILVALAGPLGSFCLCSMIRWYPALGICALMQGIWNLIPIYPMDGGRILRCLAGERVCNIVFRAMSLVLMILAVIAGMIGNTPRLTLLMLWFFGMKTGYLKNTLQRSRTRCTIEEPICKR